MMISAYLQKEPDMRRSVLFRVFGNSAAFAYVWAAVIASGLPGTGVARADGLRIDNATVAPRDASAAYVKFDISWEHSWRHGVFHDAAWVFFKVQADGKAGWRHARLVADKVVNPTGYGRGKGTPLELVVPDGEDGFVGMFVRRAADGKGAVETRNVTAVLDFTAASGVKKDVKDPRIEAFGIEMVYVAEGPFSLGSGGAELNRFYMWTDRSRDIAPRRLGTAGWLRHDDGQDTPPYRVTGSGAIPTGRQEGKLWAAGIRPADGGEIPARFPNGYAAFYSMKFHYITQGHYADFLNTLTEKEASKRYHARGHGLAIKRSGTSPNYTYSASQPQGRCPWLSWADGAAFAAWTGLRPMTELEYEKAIRGPINVGTSYWGVAGLNSGGHYERPVSAGSAAGRAFAGTHGRGKPALPADWPVDVGGAVFRNQYRVGSHLHTSGRSSAIDVFADRNLHPYAGWRAARSAPAGDTAVGPIPIRTLGHQIPRSGGRVRADGVLDEWPKPTLTLSGPADVFPVYRRFAPFDYYGRPLKPWQGPQDLSAKVYVGWDGAALCVAAEVSDELHVNTKTGSDISSGDALQMGLVTAEGVHWNIALALTRTGVALHQYVGEGDTLVKTADCAVARDEKAKVTRYELRLPLAALGLKGGAEFGLNLVFFDDDGDGQPYWLQLAPGLAGRGLATGLPVKMFPRFVLRRE
jgi:hypothetical protein